MIKGVNRQVLEVASPESPYFERVLFFVKPEYANVGENRLRAEANRLSQTKSAPPAERKVGAVSRWERYKTMIRMTAAASVGAAVTALAVYMW